MILEHILHVNEMVNVNMTMKTKQLAGAGSNGRLAALVSTPFKSSSEKSGVICQEGATVRSRTA
jgi:hypothetical protein